jgi:hypothetical protein
MTAPDGDVYRGAGYETAAEDPAKLRRSRTRWRRSPRAKIQARPRTKTLRSRGPAHADGSGGGGFTGAVLLDGHLRTQGHEPDLRAADPVVADHGALG